MAELLSPLSFKVSQFRPNLFGFEAVVTLNPPRKGGFKVTTVLISFIPDYIRNNLYFGPVVLMYRNNLIV